MYVLLRGADLEGPAKTQDRARGQGSQNGQTRLAETCSCGYTRLGETAQSTEQETQDRDCVSNSIMEGSKLVEGCVCTPGSADGHSILVAHDSRGLSIQGFCAGDPSSPASHYCSCITGCICWLQAPITGVHCLVVVAVMVVVVMMLHVW